MKWIILNLLMLAVLAKAGPPVSGQTFYPLAATGNSGLNFQRLTVNADGSKTAVSNNLERIPIGSSSRITLEQVHTSGSSFYCDFKMISETGQQWLRAWGETCNERILQIQRLSTISPNRDVLNRDHGGETVLDRIDDQSRVENRVRINENTRMRIVEIVTTREATRYTLQFGQADSNGQINWDDTRWDIYSDWYERVLYDSTTSTGQNSPLARALSWHKLQSAGEFAVQTLRTLENQTLTQSPGQNRPCNESEQDLQQSSSSGRNVLQPLHRLQVSSEGVALIKEFEGYSDRIYECAGGFSTIGYGHKIICGDNGFFSTTSNRQLWGQSEFEGIDLSILNQHRISPEIADALLRYDIRRFEISLHQKLADLSEGNNAQFSQNQYDALLSWSYNLGAGWLDRDSNTGIRTELTHFSVNPTSAQNRDQVAFEMQRWVHAGGTFMIGLARRRYAESMMFRGQDWQQANQVFEGRRQAGSDTLGRQYRQTVKEDHHLFTLGN